MHPPAPEKRSVNLTPPGTSLELVEDEYGLDPQDGDDTADPPATANPPADGERWYPQRARQPPDRYSVE